MDACQTLIHNDVKNTATRPGNTILHPLAAELQFYLGLSIKNTQEIYELRSVFINVMTYQHIKSSLRVFGSCHYRDFRSHPGIDRHLTKMYAAVQMYTAFLITKLASEMQIQGLCVVYPSLGIMNFLFVEDVAGTYAQKAQAHI